MCFDHNVLINCSEVLYISKRNKALDQQLSIEVSHMFLCAEVTKLRRKVFFYTNLDPDPEQFFGMS